MKETDIMMNNAISRSNGTQATAQTTPQSSTDHANSSHSTGVGDSGRWSTSRIALYALFVALAIVTSFLEIPLFPPAPWLKYDPSGIICLIAGFAFGPSAAATISILGFLPHMFTNPWGALMAILVSLALSVPAAYIYRRHRTRKGALISILCSIVIALIAAIIGNLIVTPLYANMSVEEVAQMIIPILLPFNLIKFALHAVITSLIYKPIVALVDGSAR